MDAACEHIDNRLTPFYPQFIREVTKEDILRLMEIKMGRILKFNTDKAEEIIAKMKSDIAEIDAHLANIVLLRWTPTAITVLSLIPTRAALWTPWARATSGT